MYQIYIFTKEWKNDYDYEALEGIVNDTINDLLLDVKQVTQTEVVHEGVRCLTITLFAAMLRTE